MSKRLVLWLACLSAFGLVSVFGCDGGGGNEDNAADDDAADDAADCIVCATTGECTAALGEGWVCQVDCCVEYGVDDDSGDDDDDDVDDDADDDSGDDDDDDGAPGDVSFVTDEVDQAGGGDRQTAIKVTSDGVVHVAYTGCSTAGCEYDKNGLFYAERAMGRADWEITGIDMVGDTGWMPSMAIDEPGNIYIVYGYHTSNQERLRLATLPVGGDWSWENIGTGRGGWWTSCAWTGDQLVTADTKLPFSGVDGTTLRVGLYDLSNWVFTIADETYDSGFYTAMSLTPDGRPVITYMSSGYPAGALKMATWTGSEWQIDEVDSNSVGNDAVIDENGYIHIVYSKLDPNNSNQWDLWYATNAPSGTWSKTPIDPGADENDDTGGFPHIAIDQNGGLHISYRNFTYDVLRYGRNTGEGWEFFDADPLGSGQYSSIAIDDDGGVHIFYEGTGIMRYAYCATCAQYAE